MYSVLKKILDNILSDIKNYGMFCPAKIYFNKETNLIEEYVKWCNLLGIKPCYLSSLNLFFENIQKNS